MVGFAVSLLFQEIHKTLGCRLFACDLNRVCYASVHSTGILYSVK